MGKISQKETDALIKGGVLSPKTVKAMKSSKMISEKKSSMKRFMKTTDGTYVEPNLYFRGARGKESSKEMNEFVSEYNKLIQKYTTTKKEDK